MIALEIVLAVLLLLALFWWLDVIVHVVRGAWWLLTRFGW